jgi:hypothetical protein
MTPNQADQQIAQWQDKQTLIEENLRSFVQLPAFERLSLQGPQHFRGKTRQKLATALDVFQSLRQRQAVLSQTLDQAKSKRDALARIMPSKQAMADIDHLLNGKSIQLAATPTPPEKRELLRDVEQAEWITPARLLEIMLDSFRFVRDTVLEISAAEEQAGQAAQNGEAAISRLRATCKALGGVGAASLASAEQSLSDLTAMATEDPLAAQVQAEAFLRTLRETSAQIDGYGRKREQVHEQLTNGQSLLQQLREAHGHAKLLRAERELKVQGPSGGVPNPTTDEELAALHAWLAKLKSTVESNQIGPAAVGLEKWTIAGTELLTRARQCADAEESMLRDRRELRGLFESLQAKAANIGKAHDSDLVNLGLEIQQVLAHRPTAMVRVRVMVAEYQRRIA